jgi:hypothetical protein
MTGCLYMIELNKSPFLKGLLDDFEIEAPNS